MRTPAIKINLLAETRTERMCRIQSMGAVSFRDSILSFWNWSDRWLWFSALFLSAPAIAGVGEFWIADIFLVLATFGVISKVFHHERLSYAVKSAATFAALLALVVFINAVDSEKGSKPWSHAQPSVESYIQNLTHPLSLDAAQPPSLPKALHAPKAPAIEKTSKPLSPGVAVVSRKTPIAPDNEAQADLEAAFVNPTDLGMMAKNISPVVAWDPKLEVELWDLDEPRNKVDATSLSLPIFTETSRGDFLKPQWSSTPRTVLDVAKTSGRMKDGDRLAGFAAITCSNCKSARWYWIFYVEGKGGWYSPIPVGQGPDQKAWGKIMEGLANDPSAEDFVSRDVVKVKIQDFF